MQLETRRPYFLDGHGQAVVHAVKKAVCRAARYEVETIVYAETYLSVRWPSVPSETRP